MPRFTPDFIDELKSRLRPSDVIGRHVKLKKQGNEWAGLSPFTKEKTPSFFVNDQKGFFHCFSSGKHGDIIGFLQETQNLQFHEAVGMLAQDAGMELPKDNPAEARREAENKGLIEACEAAAVFFQQMLGRSEGRKAVDYIRSRELTKRQVEEFLIGYAPPGRTALKDTLINKGFHEDVLAKAGLIIRPDDGGQSFDKFRDRLMFPIRNQRGQVIAFGGRALNPDARAKYMNSPETPLFHKGSVLYRYREARQASVEEKAPIIVCEGYMDVIALWGAGIKRAVAPLGTALTENQLAMIWRANDEPILCFDGDRAGIGAAYRSIDRALPMLKPGKSLSFVFLPEGQDPDDLLKAKGRTAMDEALAGAMAFVDVLWRREEEAHDLTTPERRASFKANLRTMVKTIADRDVREFYGSELANRLDSLYGPKNNDPSSRAPYKTGQYNQGGQYKKGQNRRGYQDRFAPVERISPQLREMLRVGGGQNSALSLSGEQRREATLVLALFYHPDMMDRREPEFLSLELQDSALALLLADIMSALSGDDPLDSEGLKRHLSGKATGKTLERLLNDRALNSQTFLQAEAQIDEVDWGFDSTLSHHAFETSLKEEYLRATSLIFRDDDEASGIDELVENDNENGGETGIEARIGSSHNHWKALGIAREEVINKTRASARNSATKGGSSEKLESVLEQMKASVSKADRRSSGK